MIENAIHGAPKRFRMENCTKQSLRMAPYSKVKYVNDNGNGNGVAAEVVEDSAEASKRMEDGRKKRLEEIGKEDAWFKKQTGEAPIEV